MIINEKPKNLTKFLKKFKTISYKKISKQKLHSEAISYHVAALAKKNVREIVNKFQLKIIKKIIEFALRVEILLVRFY